MVAMGTSLADRAWSRDSAVFRITGVLSVIGGWFITAGVAFTICYLLTTLMYFGSFIAMGLAILLAIYLLIRSNSKYKTKKEGNEVDQLFVNIVHSSDKNECWNLLSKHVDGTTTQSIHEVAESYKGITDAFFNKDYRRLKRFTSQLEDQRKDIKRNRRKQIVGLRRINPVLSVEKGTWYFLVNSSLSQLVYSLKRMGEPCCEHVGNNFRAVSQSYSREFISYRDEILRLFGRIASNERGEEVRNDALSLQGALSDYRKQIIADIQSKQLNIESMTVFLNMVQESQEFLSALRHTLRGLRKFNE